MWLPSDYTWLSHCAPQWTLFEHWLTRDQVEFIFMDYDLQEPLYREARHGVLRGLLRQWFQYPRAVFPSGAFGITHGMRITHT